MTNQQKLAVLLQDGAWHYSDELAAGVSHRFGASIKTLRDGSFDGRFWNIEAERTNVKGVWRYRHVGFHDSDPTKGPVCRDCGSHNIAVRDIREAA